MADGTLDNEVQGVPQIRWQGIGMFSHPVQFLGIVLSMGQGVAGDSLEMSGQGLERDVGNGLDVGRFIQKVQTGGPKQVGEGFVLLILTGKEKKHGEQVGLFSGQRVSDPSIGPGQKAEREVAIIELIGMFDPPLNDSNGQ